MVNHVGDPSTNNQPTKLIAVVDILEEGGDLPTKMNVLGYTLLKMTVGVSASFY